MLTVNDIHSQLNETEVAEVVRPASVAELVSAVARARDSELSVAVAGGRHAMGGQQFCRGGLLIDTRSLDRALDFDPGEGTIEAEAGLQWPALLAFLHERQRDSSSPWAIAQKQTGADRLSLGGAAAANAHGRGLAMQPIVADLEALTVVDAEGELRRCSRDENRDLFRLVVGGYGLFGVVYSVRLRLVPRRTLERVVEVRLVDDLVEAFDDRIATGFLYGDFQFAIDPGDEDFLRRGVFSCYRPVEGVEIPAAQRALSRDDWQKLIYLAHTDKAQAFERYSAHYLATSGQLYLSDAHQFADYVDGYHQALDARLGSAHAATEMITELYVPRERLADFMAEVADDFREHGIDVIYGTVRLIERDDTSFLAWAKEPYACVIFNLHTAHTPSELEQVADALRRLIDAASARGGSYFLTYHRYARPDQLEACYPEIGEFFALKRRFDPDELFQSDWYRYYRDAFTHA